METVEEIAKEWNANSARHYYSGMDEWQSGYIQGATDQDHIARQDEQERCIKVAQDYHCNNHCKGYCTMYSACKNCNEREEIRKVMEGGNV